MTFQNGKLYTIQKLYPDHVHWKGVKKAVSRRTNANITLVELYDVRWRRKPFPWSYHKEFKAHRRWFYHGTSIANIQKILHEGFKVTPAITSHNGRMLGDGIYSTYHTHKGKWYGVDQYVISVMVYTPKILVIQKGQTFDNSQIPTILKSYDAIEVRRGSTVVDPVQKRTCVMKNHEICVYDTRRTIPRFILKLA